MTVRFACECGKRLTARNDMRGKHLQCPACFSLVPIPARQFLRLFGPEPNKRTDSRRTAATERPRIQTAAVKPRETTQSRRSRSRPHRDSAAAIATGQPPFIRLRRPPRWTRLLTQPDELHWPTAVENALAKVPIFFWLSIVLSVMTAAALFAWVSIDRLQSYSNIQYQVFAFSLILIAYTLGSTCTYFNSILALAARGKTKLEPGIEASPLRALQNCGVWLACFSAGPALVFGAAFVYWLRCGELMFVDWMILAELGFVGLGWWLVALLLANAANSFYVPAPRQVLRTAFHMRGKAIELILLATAVFAGHLLLADFALAQLHKQPLLAFLLLCLFWGSSLFCTAFTLRRLGLAYYRLPRELR